MTGAAQIESLGRKQPPSAVNQLLDGGPFPLARSTQDASVATARQQPRLRFA